MEKGIAGDRLAAQMQAAPPAAGPMATVERGTEGRDTKPMETPRPKRRAGGGGGAPSGSITHPDSDKIAKDADGTWRYTDEKGNEWVWAGKGGLWRDANGATSILGDPKDLAFDMTGSDVNDPEAR